MFINIMDYSESIEYLSTKNNFLLNKKSLFNKIRNKIYLKKMIKEVNNVEKKPKSAIKAEFGEKRF